MMPLIIATGVFWLVVSGRILMKAADGRVKAFAFILLSVVCYVFIICVFLYTKVVPS